MQLVVSCQFPYCEDMSEAECLLRPSSMKTLQAVRTSRWVPDELAVAANS